MFMWIDFSANSTHSDFKPLYIHPGKNTIYYFFLFLIDLGNRDTHVSWTFSALLNGLPVESVKKVILPVELEQPTTQ